MVLKNQYRTIVLEAKDDVITVFLNRPDIHNAFNDEMIRELKDLFLGITEMGDCTAIIVTGSGNSFCAGADLNWMKRMASYSHEENVADAGNMAEMFESISDCPIPTIARVNGAAFGGGVGLVTVCDFAFATENAKFAFSEVKLGLIPAVISKYVIERIGPTKARQLFMTGEKFDAAYASQIGLLDGVVHDLDGSIDELLKNLRTGGRAAIAEAKRLVMKSSEDDFTKYCISTIADLRASEEGSEGVGAFLEKRKPEWRKDE